MELEKPKIIITESDLKSNHLQQIKGFSSECPSVGILITDINSNIIFISETASRLLDIPVRSGEVLSFFDFLPPESIAVFKESIGRQLKGEKLSAQKYLFRRTDNSKFWAKIYTIHDYNLQGEIVGFNIIIYDLLTIPIDHNTEERVVNENADTGERYSSQLLYSDLFEYKTFLHSIPAFFVVLTNELKVDLINNKMLKESGYLRDETTNKDFTSLFIPMDERLGFVREVEHLKKGMEGFYIENNILTKEGRKILIRWKINLFLTGISETVYYIFAGNDITRERNNEIESLEYKIKLEELADAREKQLVQANELLKKEINSHAGLECSANYGSEKDKEIIELKSNFLSYVSHEFKIPLTAIYSSAELLEKYGRKWEKDKYTSQLISIKRQIVYLNEVMDDILSLGKTDFGITPLKTDKINLKLMCSSLLEDFKTSLLSVHELYFKIELENETYNIDGNKIKHIILNLLSNAVKYSPEGGKIELFIKEEKENIIISVSDEGIGIRKEDENDIFAPFKRGTNVNGIKGSGLGLSIVKNAVELHNGKIEYSSRPEKGTIFKVVIPVNRGELHRNDGKENINSKVSEIIKYPDKPEAKSGGAGSRIIKILVIENSEEVFGKIKTLLDAGRYKAIHASNGSQGMFHYKLFKPDLILCNTMMLGINVQQFIREIHNSDLPIPFVFISSNSNYRDFRKGMELGADDYISETYDNNDLIKVIERCLSRYKLLKSPHGISIPVKHENRENIFVRYCGRMLPIPLDKILYIHVEGQYSEIFLEGNKQYTLKKSLCRWESILPESVFIRIHRSTIANINQIKKIERISNNSYNVYMMNTDSTLILSRRYFKLFKQRILAV